MAIPNLAQGVSGILSFVVNKWYFLIIGGLIVAVVLAIMNIKKLKNLLKRHSEIKEHHEIVEKELKLNPTSIKHLYQGDKKIGEIDGLIFRKIKEERDIKGKKNKEIIEKNYWSVGVKTKGIGVGDVKVWVGKKHFLFPENIVFFEKDRMYLSSNISLEYYLGYYIPPNQQDKIFTQTQFYRTMMDKTVDGMGTQMIKFSNVRDEWAHVIAMKEKEIERIKEEKKLATTKAR